MSKGDIQHSVPSVFFISTLACEQTVKIFYTFSQPNRLKSARVVWNSFILTSVE